METPMHNELKKEFQLERMILFSDAVFAIAITLLVIEMKVPEISRELISEDKLIEALAELIPKFIGFLVSFFIIGLYWTVHHRMFGFVINYNQRLLWLNLLFLLSIALMPFSTAFYSDYLYTFFKTPVLVYASNICFLGIMNYVLWRYIGKPERHLAEGLTKTMCRYFSIRAIMVPLAFILMTIIYIYFPWLAVFIPVCIPLMMFGIKKLFGRKLAQELKQTHHSTEHSKAGKQ